MTSYQLSVGNEEQDTKAYSQSGSGIVKCN